MSDNENLDIENATALNNNRPYIIAVVVILFGIASVFLLSTLDFGVTERPTITASNDDEGYFEDKAPDQPVHKPLIERDEAPPTILSRPPVAAEKPVKRRTQLTFADGGGGGGGSAPTSADRSVDVDSLARDIARASKSAGGELVPDKTSVAGRVGGTSVAEAFAYTRNNHGDLVNAGTVVPACLANAVNSALPGNLVAVVSRDVYSSDGLTLLIPKHSQLFGEYQSGQTQGEIRLFAIWHRVRVDKDTFIDVSSPAVDTLGRSGLDANVDSRFFKRFGAALLLSILPVFIDDLVGAEASDREVVRAAGEQLNDAAAIALNSSINIAPILSIPQGQCFNVLVAKDLNFRGVL